MTSRVSGGCARPTTTSSAGIMCRVRTPLTRRAVLRGGLAVAAGTAVGTVVAACDRGPSPEQITAAALLPLADAALADQAAAQTLSPQEPEYAKALTVIAQQRGQHATSLREEITRLDQDTAGRIGAPAGTSTAPTGDATAGTSAGAAPTTVATVSAMRSRLTRSARAAGDAAVACNGYAAGLAGSISAAVTTMAEVQLG